MSINKNEAQQSVKYSEDITSAYRIVVITPSEDATVPYGDLSGVSPNNGLLYKLWQDLQAIYVPETIEADSDKYINLGAKTDWRYIVIRYTAVRGSLMRGGMIEVLNDGTNAIANDSYLPYTDDDSWLSCANELAIGSQIQIKLTTNDVDEEDTIFTYRIVERIPIP